MRLMPQRRLPVFAACAPALADILQIRHRDGHSAPSKYREEALAWPKHQRRPSVGSLERGSLVAGCFLELLLIGLHVVESIGRRHFSVVERQRAERRWHVVGPPPIGKPCIAIEGLARLVL